MLPFLEEFKGQDNDVLQFLPGDDEGDIVLQSGKYIDEGTPIGGSTLGDAYHINLLKFNKEGDPEFDSFDSILVDPLTYMSHIIPAGFYGIIARKTTTSKEANDDVYSKFQAAYAE